MSDTTNTCDSIHNVEASRGGHQTSGTARSIRLPSAFCSYLDLLRSFSAILVLIGHAIPDAPDTLKAGRHFDLEFGHEAVMLFFIMSGLIVHNSCVSKQTDWLGFFIARTARIVSVTLPAILFTVMLLCFASSVAMDLGEQVTASQLATRILFSSLFLNESWLVESSLPLNAPFWSLCYEVWFYTIFGFAWFSRGIYRFLAIGACALLQGPAIVVLLPVWLLGVAISAKFPRIQVLRISTSRAVAAFTLSVIIIASIHLLGLDRAIQSSLKNAIPGIWRLGYSQRFVTDIAIGILFAVHLISFLFMPREFLDFIDRGASRFRKFADSSFTVYLFHFPMLLICEAAFPTYVDSAAGIVCVCLIVFMICQLISVWTERRLTFWRRSITALVGRSSL